jgi:molybdate transport system regulatory protein
MTYSDVDSEARANVHSGAMTGESPDPDRPRLWFRALLPGGALGPGKIALMQAIAAEGSVSRAARTLGISHARSVKLVSEINALGAAPLIDTRTGGPAGGGASLTPLGQEVLGQYLAMADAVAAAASGPLAVMSGALAGPDAA